MPQLQKSVEIANNSIPTSTEHSTAEQQQTFYYTTHGNEAVYTTNENNEVELISSGGYKLTPSGMLEISDAAFQIPIEPNDSSMTKIHQLLSTMAFRMSKMDSKLDIMAENFALILKALSTESANDQKILPPVETSEPGTIITYFKPIDTINDLNEFEQKLKNPLFHKESVRFINIIYKLKHLHICTQ